jgi:type II secretory pathway pseudopilin PulG
MKTNISAHAFSLVEILLAMVLLVGVSVAVWRLSATSQRFETESASLAQQNVYTTLRAQIAAQGLNPVSVTNLAAQVLTDGGGISVVSFNPNSDLRQTGFRRSLVASFEKSAVVAADIANRAQPGSARRIAINYLTPSLSLQSAKGIGFGYSIDSAGSSAPASTTPLAAPTFNYDGDLSFASFPLNGIIAYPANPPGTTYRYTTDGTVPTMSSPLWVNNPGWTSPTGATPFPPTATVVAFNSDPQYSPSSPATAQFSYNTPPAALSASYSRADGRTDLFHFTFDDLQTAPTTGIVLTPSIRGATILYTMDGSDPLSSSTAVTYSGPFAPSQSSFNPINAILTVVVSSSDSQYVTSPPATYVLIPKPVTLPDPSIATDNSLPLPAGSDAIIDFGDATANDSPSVWLLTSNGGLSFGDNTTITLN